MQKGFFEANDYQTHPQTKRKYREIPIFDRKNHPLRIWMFGQVIPKDKSKVRHYEVGRLVWGQQSDSPEKVMIIEELQWEDGRKELRFCYRILTHKTGAWHWGQYALMTPRSDIEEMLSLAAEKGMLSLKSHP